MQPELEYIFKHALTQEVVYNGLLIKERRSIHEKIGLVMEELFHDRLSEFYETLAYHYTLSGNSRKAFDYLKLAGDKAARSYAQPESVRFYKDAIRVLDAQPQNDDDKREMIEVCISLLTPLHFLGYPEGSIEILQKAEGLAQEIKDSRSLITVYSKIGYYHAVKGNPLLAIVYSEKAFNEAEKFNDIELMATLAREICLAHFITGNNAKVLDIARRAIPPIEEFHREKDLYTGGVNIYSALCAYYGMASGWLGEILEGKAILEKGLQNAHDVNDKFELGFIEVFYSSVTVWEGDGYTTIDHAQKAIKHAEEAGLDIMLGSVWNMLGAGYFLVGEYDTSKNHHDKSIKIQHVPSFLPWNYLFSAMNYLAAGDRMRAKEHFEESLKLSLEFNNKAVEGVARILLGVLAGKADPSHINDALQQIQQGFFILEERKLKPLIAFGYLHLGELFSHVGRKEEALENLKKAEALYLKMKVTPKSYWLKRTQDALAKLESTQ